MFQRPALPPEDEADLARRIALGKLLARERIPADAAAALEQPGGPVAASVIPPLAGKDAFAARERHLIGEASAPLRKTHLVMRHVREIGRIIRRPLGDTRV